MRRRELAACLLALAAGLPSTAGRAAAPGPPLNLAEWRTFAARFITAEGRVLDTGNGGVSHTEGQGYGMLLAVAFDDPAAFGRVWSWTRDHLAVRDDGLFAWKWDERAAAGPIPDRNSAADGDLLIAWALARGARRWADAGYAEAARRLAAAVRAGLVRHSAGWTVILPGQDGFAHDGVATVNPSYWVFPALPEMAAVDPDPAWAALDQDGRRLLATARFGPARLPPDWLELGPTLRPSPRFPRIFGYNAVRVPLYLAWAGGPDSDGLLAPFRALWTAAAAAPPMQAETDLDRPEKHGHPASAGATAVAQLTLYSGSGPAPNFPALAADADYYSAVLLLLAKLAYAERYAR